MHIGIDIDNVLSEHYSNVKRENVFFICSTLLKPEVIIEYCKHYIKIFMMVLIIFLYLDMALK